MMRQLLKQRVCPVWRNMNQSTRINSCTYMYHQQRFYTDNEGVQRLGIVGLESRARLEPHVFRLETKYTDMTKEIIDMNAGMDIKFAGMDIKFADMKADMNIKFTDMNTKFAEQSGKMKVIQYQLGTVITLVTVIGGFIGFTVKKGVDVFIEKNAEMAKMDH